MGSSHDAEQEVQATATFCHNGGRCRARCKLCVGNKTLSCACNTTSNFKKHLEKVHKNVELESRQVEGAKRRNKCPKVDNDEDGDNQPVKRQCTLPLMLKDISSTKLCNVLAEYVIEDVLPLSTVESLHSIG